MVAPSDAAKGGRVVLQVASFAARANADRALAMPSRKQTRDADRRDRIVQERRERAGLIAEEERQRQAWLAANYQPPPF